MNVYKRVFAAIDALAWARHVERCNHRLGRLLGEGQSKSLALSILETIPVPFCYRYPQKTRVVFHDASPFTRALRARGAMQ